MKTYYLFTSLIFAALLCVSCDNDDINTSSRPPVFESLTLTPNNVKAGENVKAVVKYSYAGKDIYKSDYRISISKGADYQVTYDWTVVDPTKSEPEYSFNAPEEAGTYEVVFRANKINYSSHGPNGELYGNANSVNAILRVY
ncbi:MAG: hypothetical protein ACI3YI_09440 [Bacteroidaceae bacterium]